MSSQPEEAPWDGSHGVESRINDLLASSDFCIIIKPRQFDTERMGTQWPLHLKTT